jgi:hypothetical protein
LFLNSITNLSKAKIVDYFIRMFNNEEFVKKDEELFKYAMAYKNYLLTPNLINDAERKLLFAVIDPLFIII